MDDLASSPEIIGAIIGGIFLLITTLIGGWFNVRAAQIRAETERGTRSPTARSRKAEQPAIVTETIEQKQHKRPLPNWLLVIGATIGIVLLIGGLALAGIIPVLGSAVTITPTKTSLDTAGIDSTPIPTTGTPTHLGLDGNLVEHNNDWSPFFHTVDGIKVALVPAGCFDMGSQTGDEDEKGGEQECFYQAFWLTVTEVTNAQYAAKIPNAHPGEFSGDESPRESILWREAAAFCDIWGGRLPTEAEWEYAARGPDNLPYPWGDSILSDVRAVYYTKDNTQKGPLPVGSKPLGASWVGALDMSGNVWEWVNSIYKPYPYDKDDGRESVLSTEDRVLRGGSYEGNDIRASERYSRDGGYTYISVGFRCARDRSPSDPIPEQ